MSKVVVTINEDLYKKFSFPYTCFDGKDYCSFIDKYSHYTNSVFCNLPFAFNLATHATPFLNKLTAEQVLEYDNNLYCFLEQSKNKFKRVIVFNLVAQVLTLSELTNVFNNKIIPFLKEYNIEVFVTTNFNIALLVKSKIPNIEIQTSCNSFHFLERQYRIWQEELNVEVFNPPREILRLPSLLNELKLSNIKIKAIVNESCLMGCPNMFTHVICQSYGYNFLEDINWQCHLRHDSNFFKSNWVIPRWLKDLNNKVDIYKIAGRTLNQQTLGKIINAYINYSDDVNIFELLLAGTAHSYGAYEHILCKDIPNRLLTCECKCEKNNCGLCENLANRYLKKQ